MNYIRIIKVKLLNKYFVYSQAFDNIKKEYKMKANALRVSFEEKFLDLVSNLQIFLLMLSEEKIKFFGYEVSVLHVLFFCLLGTTYVMDNVYCLMLKIN